MSDRVQNMMPTIIDQFPLPDVERMADYVAKSGLFGAKTKDQAVALMMLAQAEGMHPMIAARDYDIIQGRPSKKAEAMLRDFQRAGGSVQWHSLSDEEAKATFSHPQGGTVTIDWDMKRAAASGLGGKDMWKKFPRQMLRSRVVSEGCKTVWPSATSGMYTPEETADFQPSTAPVQSMRDITPPAQEQGAGAAQKGRRTANQKIADLAAGALGMNDDKKPVEDVKEEAKTPWIWIAADGRFKTYDGPAQWIHTLAEILPRKTAKECSDLMSRMNDTFNQLRDIDGETVEEAQKLINERFTDANNG